MNLIPHPHRSSRLKQQVVQINIRRGVGVFIARDEDIGQIPVVFVGNRTAEVIRRDSFKWERTKALASSPAAAPA